jgi:hypothetical protein
MHMEHLLFLLLVNGLFTEDKMKKVYTLIFILLATISIAATQRTTYYTAPDVTSCPPAALLGSVCTVTDNSGVVYTKCTTTSWCYPVSGGTGTVDLSSYQSITWKDVSNGYAGLDGNGLVPESHMTQTTFQRLPVNAGFYSTPTMTYIGGILTLASVSCAFVETDGSISLHSIPSLTATLMDQAVNYVNAVRSSNTWTVSTVDYSDSDHYEYLKYGELFRSGSNAHQQIHPLLKDYIEAHYQRVLDTDRYARVPGGLEAFSKATDSTTISLSGGFVYAGEVLYSIPATSWGGTRYFRSIHSSGTWSTLSDLWPRIDNTRYDDGVNSQTPPAGTYIFLDYSRGVETPDHLYSVPSLTFYTSMDSCLAVKTRPAWPGLMSSHTIFIGRICSKENSTLDIDSTVLSAFTSVFGGSTPVTAHNSLSGLQGGGSGNYYHSDSLIGTIASHAAGEYQLVSGMTTSIISQGTSSNWVSAAQVNSQISNSQGTWGYQTQAQVQSLITGSAVQLTGTQTVAGAKTFSSIISGSVTGTSATAGNVTGLVAIANGGTNNGSLVVTAGTAYYGDGTKLLGLAPRTATYSLHSGTTPTWSSSPNLLTVLTSTTTTATTNVGIGSLSFNVSSAIPYYFSCYVAATGTATGAPRMAVVSSGAVTDIMYSITSSNLVSAVTTSSTHSAASGTQSVACTSGCLTTNIGFNINGMVMPSASGIISVAHSNSTSGQTTTTKAGSMCQWWTP